MLKIKNDYLNKHAFTIVVGGFVFYLMLQVFIFIILLKVRF